MDKDAGRSEEVMSEEQARVLKRLAEQAFEPEAFNERLTRAEAQLRIAALTAKLKLQGEPPHPR